MGFRSSLVSHFSIATLSLASFGASAQEQAASASPTFKAGPALQWSSGDGQFEYKLGGMILLDHLLFSPDKAHTELTQNTAGRAIRLNFEGALYKDWSFKAQYDFASDIVNVRHAWLQYNFNESNSLRVGQQGVEPGIWSAASIAQQITMERPMGQRVWGQRFSTGASYRTEGERWMAVIGAYEMNDETDTKKANLGRQYLLRATTNPLSDETHLLHLGLFGATTHYENSAHPQFRVNPVGTTLTELYIIDSGVLNSAKSFQTYGAEFLYSYKQVALTSEMQMVQVQQIDGAEDLDFGAYNVDLYYFFTGERIPYKKNPGGIGSLKVSGKGALAAFLRYDSIDMADKTVDGGKEVDVIGGLSWWPNSLMKFTLQYTQTQTDKAGVSDDPSAVGVRMQVAF